MKLAGKEPRLVPNKAYTAGGSTGSGDDDQLEGVADKIKASGTAPVIGWSCRGPVGSALTCIVEYVLGMFGP